ncbi:MAG TPA: hypothetical protein VJ782_10440 [Aeromicrobium sp.]|nr:hypothetical protein [Aeromicrobium sp.]
MTPRLIQVFEVSDARAQELIVGLLRGVQDLEVEAALSGPDFFVITECDDAFQAESVARIVHSIDFDARLTETRFGPSESLSA